MSKPSYIDIIEPLCHVGCIELLSKFPNFNANDIAPESIVNNSYIHYACFRSDLHVVKVFMECGANILCTNMHDQTPFYVACGNSTSEDRVHLVQWLLLQPGIIAQLNHINTDGSTPLHHASCWNNKDVVRLLLKLCWHVVTLIKLLHYYYNELNILQKQKNGGHGITKNLMSFIGIV